MAHLMTIKEFQEEYCVSRSTVYRLEERGEISFVRIGRAVRIEVADAQQWFAALKVNADNDES